MRSTMNSNRRGASLPELLIAIMVLGILGTASVRLLVSQTGFYDRQVKQRSARSVSRGAVNMVLSELRMVESTGGVEDASATSVTLRVPYMIGMVCGTVGPVSVLALLPADSTVLANATASGHAWRTPAGTYQYTNGSVTVFTHGAAAGFCTANNISPVPSGRIVVITPGLPAASAPGDAAFLYQRIKYEFANSDVLPGRRALWRTVVDTDTREEVAAPFDNSARFRFFQLNRDTSDVAAPPNQIRGLELVFDGASQSARAGSSTPERSPFRTAVFFNNRIN